MKKTTAIFTLSCLLSTPSFSKEKNFQYKTRTGTYITGGITALGIGMFTTAIALDTHGKGPIGGYLYGLAGVAVAEVGIVSFLSVASTTGTRKVDSKKYKYEYKKMKIISKSVLRSDILPQSENFSFVINNFDCNNCSTDLETVKAFSAMFTELDQLAHESVSNETFNPKKPEEIFSNKEIQNKIESILGENDTPRNKRLANTTFAMALANRIF